MEYLMTEEDLRSAWETCTWGNYAQMDVICQGADDDRDYLEDDYYRRSIYRVLRCHSCLSVVVLRYTTRGSELPDGDLAELGDWRDYHHWTREIILSGQRHVDNLVPKHIATDYREAAAIVHLSPKASAALSRRCLQAILREAGGVPNKISRGRSKPSCQRCLLILLNLSMPFVTSATLRHIRLKTKATARSSRLSLARLNGIWMYWICSSSSTMCVRR